MIILQLIVDDVDALMTAGYTLIRVYTDTTPTGTFVTLDGTVTLVAAQESYEYSDAGGTSATYYKTAYYGAGPGESTKSDALQGGVWTAYATLEDLKEYLGIATTTRADDVLLADCLDRASKAIDNHTGYNFWPEAETRYYESEDVDGYILYLDRSLTGTPTTVTNGDSAGTTIASTEYWLIPRNAGPPYYAIRLKADSDYSWEFDTDYWVSIAGEWGWGTTPPLDVEQACIRLSAYYYAQKDAPVFETTVFPDSGIVSVPTGMPVDVKQLLEPYRKRIG